MISKHIFTSDVVSGKAFWLNNLQSTGNLVTANGNFTITNDATILGDLTVKGSTTTIDTVTLTVDDHNIELGSIDNPTDSTANGGGITLKGSTDKTFNWSSDADAWESNVGLNVLGGNVGIGTTSPDEMLHIRGTSPNIKLTDTDTSLSSLLYADTGMGSLVFVSDATGEGTNPFISARIGGTAIANEKMRITSAGNVGIGTTSPGAKLVIQEDSVVNTLTEAVSFLGGNYTSASNAESFKFFHQTNTANTNRGVAFKSIDGSLQIQTIVTSSNVDAANNISLQPSDGNVGIGTTDPGAKLEIFDSIKPVIKLNGTGNNALNTNFGEIQFYNRDGSGDGPNVAASIHAQSHSSTGSGGSLVFSTENSAAGVEGQSAEPRMIILSNGNVGIGTTNPISANSRSSVLVVGGGSGMETSGITLGMGSGYSNGPYEIFTSSEGSLASLRISDGTDARLTIRSNGNVGIGTTSPAYELEIKDSSNDAYISVISPNIDNAGILFGDTDASARGGIIYENNNNSLAFRTNNNTEKMRIDSDGNVGIGTTSPSNSKLHVAGGHINLDDNNAIAWGGGSDRPAIVGDKPNNTLKFYPSSNPAMTIDSNGNVGIGTTSPGAKLHINQEDANGYATNLFTTTTESFSIGVGGTSAPEAGLRDKFYIYDNASSGGAARLVINSAGNVGIGTTSPARTLHIVDSTSDGSGGIKVQNYKPVIELLDANVDATATTLTQNQTKFTIANNGVDSLTIDSAGNVGIGTTTPAARLTIAQPGTTIGGNDISKGCFLAGSSTEGIGIDDNEIVKKGPSDTGSLVIANANANGEILLRTNLQNRLVISNSGASLTGHLTTSGSITVNNSSPVLVLRDTNGGDTVNQNGFISYRDNSDTERGYVGFGSTSTKDFTVSNKIGDINLNSKAGGKVYIPTSLQLGNGVTLAESADRADLLKIQGITSGYAGVVISNTNGEDLWSLMADGNLWGVYNDTTNEWHIQCYDNGSVELFYNNGEKLTTSASGVSINGDIDKVSDVYVQDQIIHHGDTDTYMQFHAANEWRVVAGGQEVIECQSTAFNVAKNTSLAGTLTVAENSSFSKDLTVQGSLTVNGDLVTLNTTNLDVADKVITVAKADEPSNTTADESGISFGGMASILYDGDSQRVYIASSSFDGDSITDNTITNAKLSNMAGNTIKLRNGSGNGNPSDFALQNEDILICNGEGFTATSLSGDVSMSNTGSVSIGNDKVTNLKLSNMAANTIKLRNAASNGNPTDFALQNEDILICNGEGFTATSLSGDVSMSNTGSVSIGDGKVTFSKIQNTNAGIVGRTATGSGDVSSLSASSVRTFLNVAEIIDEDDFVSNSSEKVPSQQSVKAFVESAISSVDIDTTDLITKSDSNTQSIVSNFTVGGFLTVNGANTSGQSIIAAQDIVAMSSNTSDERLKENILKIDSALNKVCSLEGFTFNWNTKAKSIGISSAEKQIGLSAQSTEKVFPEAVKKLPDSEYKYINYEKLVPALVESIKELKAEIEELKKKI